MSIKIIKVLKTLEKQSGLEKSRKIDIPRNKRMLAITKDTGEFYNILLKSSNAKNILEIGTSTGYSTLWFAKALKENNKENSSIVTIEENPDKVKRAKENFQNAGVSDLIQIINQNALNALHAMSEKIKNSAFDKFDFIFLDADKENMKTYFDILIDMIKVGGIIATDNIFYPEKYRHIMEEYTKHVRSKKNVETVTIPIGNGEELTFKKSN